MLARTRTRLALLLLFYGMLVATGGAFGQTPASATLAWDGSTDSRVAGYRLYWGGASRTYTNRADAGNATSVSVSSLVAGETYYFAATSYTADGQESAFSAEVSYTCPLPGPTLAEALDTPGWTWVTGTNPTGWFGQRLVTHDGAGAGRSGVLGNKQASWMETTVSGPGTVSFWWKVSSETNYDYLRFAVDGVEQARISGETGWVQRSSAIGAGDHTLRWTYTKDPAVAGGQDAGWVDQVSFVRALVVSGIASLPQTERGANPDPASPRLLITSENRALRLSWPLSAADWVPEQTLTLEGAAPGWTTLSPASWQTNATGFSLTIPWSGSHRFYRLHKP